MNVSCCTSCFLLLLWLTWHSLPLPLLLLLRVPFCSVVGALHELLSDSSVLLPIVKPYYCYCNSREQDRTRYVSKSELGRV
jgi:hypothetical protein